MCKPYAEPCESTQTDLKIVFFERLKEVGITPIKDTTAEREEKEDRYIA